MYSWKNIRTFCAFLLLLPIVHLAYLVSRDALATLDHSPRAWEREVQAYARTDQASRREPGAVVVVGGQRVRLWRGLEDLLAPTPVLMRGLGNATVDDITYYYERLIGNYGPRTLVILPGTSEFHIRDAKSAQELVDAIRKLAELDGRQANTDYIYVFAPLKTPVYPQDGPKIDETTDLLRRWAAGEPRVRVIDANPLLTRKNGSAKPDFFRPDGINLNDHGYLRLAVLLQQQLERDAGDGTISALP